MDAQPKSLLSHLLDLAWTVLVIAVLLRIAVSLLEQVWMWIVAIVALAILIRIWVWLRRVRRDYW